MLVHGDIYIYIQMLLFNKHCQTNMEELIDLTQESEGQML